MQLDKSCEEQNIHADDIRGNFEMITKRKVEWYFSKLTPIRESLVKFVTEKNRIGRGRRGNAQKIMNNCRTAPFAKVSAGQGFLQMRQFIYP